MIYLHCMHVVFQMFVSSYFILFFIVVALVLVALFGFFSISNMKKEMYAQILLGHMAFY